MKENPFQSVFLAFVVLTVLMSGCAPASTTTPTPIPPTLTPEPTATAAQSQVTNMEAPGNLESTQSIGCESVSNLKNTYTPPDLYNGMVECIKQENYSSAIFLMALAGTYGYYDALRVADGTAHDAQSILAQRSLSSLDNTQMEAFKQELQTTLGNPDKFPALCDEILRFGPPQYYPRYMIQHGMNASTGGKPEDELVKDFDSDMAWKTSLDGYLHCPNPISSSDTATP